MLFSGLVREEPGAGGVAGTDAADARGCYSADSGADAADARGCYSADSGAVAADARGCYSADASAYGGVERALLDVARKG